MKRHQLPIQTQTAAANEGKPPLIIKEESEIAENQKEKTRGVQKGAGQVQSMKMKNDKEKKKPIQVEQSLAGQRNVVSKKLINYPKESAQTAAKGKVSQKDAGQVRSMKMNKEKGMPKMPQKQTQIPVARPSVSAGGGQKLVVVKKSPNQKLDNKEQ